MYPAPVQTGVEGVIAIHGAVPQLRGEGARQRTGGTRSALIGQQRAVLAGGGLEPGTRRRVGVRARNHTGKDGVSGVKARRGCSVDVSVMVVICNRRH